MMRWWRGVQQRLASRLASRQTRGGYRGSAPGHVPTRPEGPGANVNPGEIDAALVFFLSDVTQTVTHLRTVLHDDHGAAAALHVRGQLDRLAERVERFTQGVERVFDRGFAGEEYR